MDRRGSLSIFACFCAAFAARAEMTYYAYPDQIRTFVLVGGGKPAKTGNVGKIDSMEGLKLGGSWNIEFTGALDVPAAGTYAFSLTSDDGSALYIDGKLAINNDGLHGDVTKKSETPLTPGKHAVNLIYFNNNGGHGLKAEVTPPGGKAADLASACTPGGERIDFGPQRAEALKRAEVENQQERERAAVEQQRMLAQMSSPEALVRSIRHIIKTKPRLYKNGRAFLAEAEGYVKSMPEIIEKAARKDPEALKALTAFGELKRKALLLENPYIDFDEVFTVLTDKVALKSNWVGTHTMGQHGYRNKLVRFNFRTGQVADVYKPRDKEYIGEPDLHYDAKKALFTSISPSNTWEVYEVNLDGTGFRQATTITGQYVHNYGGIYLPDEKIVFSSTAPMIGVPCIGGSATVPNLYVMDADGRNTRQITFEQDADWYPTVREDGQIMYLRWEYTDIMHYYSRIMMTMNPDGSNQRAIYGSQSLWPNSMMTARPVPDRPGQFIAVVTGHHDSGGEGKLTLFDTNKGHQHADGVVQHIPGYGKKVVHATVDQLYPKVKPHLLKEFPDLQENVDKLIAEHMKDQAGKDYHDLNNDFFNRCYPRLRGPYPNLALDLDGLVGGQFPHFTQPYPVSADYIISPVKLTGGSRWTLYLVDTFDNFVPLQPDKLEEGYAHMIEPYPIRPRARPPVIPSKVNLKDKEGVVYIQNVYRGVGTKGVPEGTIDSLRLFTYAYGYYRTGNHHVIGIESGWDIKRMLGTVKVEKDGSAMFRVPANTVISVQPLDKQGRAIQLFRSWLVAMPGEKLACVGCHEPPNEPPVTRKTAASGKPPQAVTPYHGNGVEGFAFDMEVQPVLDAYCIRCHDGTDTKKPNFKDKELLKTGDASKRFSNSYIAFHKYFRRPGPESCGTMNPPYEFHASSSEGVQLLEKGHYGVKLDEESWRRINTWIDLNVPYHGNWTSVYSVNDNSRTWTTNIAAHAAALRAKYANLDVDWEEVPAQPYPITPTKEKSEERAAPVNVSVSGWPFDAETAKRLQQQAGGGQKRTLDLGNGLAVTLVRIPAGEFVMGSDEETALEQPRHVVKIAKPFWMSENEINNALFFAFKPDHSAGIFDQQWKDHVRLGYYANYDEQPATRVSWLDADAFCAWAAKKAGAKIALPTEAQWEWACRAGSASPMNFGAQTADFSPYANLADKSIEKFAVSGVNPTHGKGLVGQIQFDFIPRVAEFDDKQFLVTGTRQYQPNAWGLYDMHGNVSEWTRSDYARYPYAAKSDAKRPDVKKVARGGSFFDRPYRATSSYRLGYEPWQPVFNVGFRIVLEE